MFRLLARQLGLGGARRVLDLHPMQLSRYVEEVWINRSRPPFGQPTRLDVPGVLVPLEATASIGANVPGRVAAWPHLIYAYMIENTRVYEIFGRVLQHFLSGEQLGVAGDATQRWLRTTEALFYRDSPPFQIYSVTSWVRPDARAARRNAYYRMFGMDLNHGTDDGRPYPYEKPRAANREFVVTFEELMREAWRGIENVNNFAGANPTDVATVADLAQTLDEMMSSRRLFGNLYREELWWVSLMSWFHLTLSFDSPIVVDLAAEAAAPAERLMKIAVQVGLPAHSRSHSYFEIADPIERILRFVEAGRFNTPGSAPSFWTQAAIRDDMTDVISQWSLATGRDMKARKVAVTATTTTLPGQVRRPGPAPAVRARRRIEQSVQQTDGTRAGAPT